MVKFPGSDVVYEFADRFREECLVKHGSLLWPGKSVWTEENVNALWDAFIGHPDTSDKSFLEKWRLQLADCSEDVHRLAAEAMALYHLPETNVGAATKISDIEQIVAWKLSADPPNLGTIREAYEHPIVNPGMRYLAARPWQVAFYLAFPRELWRETGDPSDWRSCQEVADAVAADIAQNQGNCCAARNILLHMLFPDEFEVIASERVKRKICEAFGRASPADEDAALREIRRELATRFGPDFLFYQSDVRAIWDPSGDTLLLNLADFLETTRLDDPDILSPDGWQELVKPVTRPVLEKLAKTTGLEGNYFKGKGTAKITRTQFDSWGCEVGDYSIGIYIGLNEPRPADSANLEVSLLWGIYKFGGGIQLRAAKPLIGQIQLHRPDFVLREMSAEPFGGAYLLLYKALQPAELRQRKLDELAEEIATDLKELHAAVESSELLLVGAIPKGGPELPRLTERLEAGGPVAWWWSFPLGDKALEVAKRTHTIHIYTSQGAKTVTHRVHFTEVETSSGDAGIPSPWPEFALEEELGRTAMGEGKMNICKTWFLVDSIEDIDPPLSADDYKAAGGGDHLTPLKSAFVLWRRKAKAGEGADVSDDGDGIRELIDRTNMDESDITDIKSLLEDKRQLIFEGPPGSGKTYVAKLFARHFTGNPLDGEADERVTIVQFHQSYGYEDFIEGIRPETRDGQVVYEVRPGIFKEVCERTAVRPDDRFVVIIDEINRGNLSRIFGELLLALEYREDNTTVKLPYSGDEFSIPENVYLIGTMNTTDRSLALIDYALRRRFYFYRLTPVEDGKAKFLARWLDKQPGLATQRDRILRLFIALNQKVQAELGEHFQVGHSYFMTLKDGSDAELDRLWKHAITPLLEEYFHSRPKRAELLAQLAWRTLLRPAQLPAEASAELEMI